MKGGTFVHKRINITLPEETSKANLRRRLKAGYERRADRDLETAEAWFSLDEEAWS